MSSLLERKYRFIKREPFFYTKNSLQIIAIREELFAQNGVLVNCRRETLFVSHFGLYSYVCFVLRIVKINTDQNPISIQ